MILPHVVIFLAHSRKSFESRSNYILHLDDMEEKGLANVPGQKEPTICGPHVQYLSLCVSFLLKKHWQDSFLRLHQSPVFAVVLQGGPGKIEGGIFCGVLGLQVLDLRRRTLTSLAQNLDVRIMYGAVIMLHVLRFAHSGVDGEFGHVIINRGDIKTLFTLRVLHTWLAISCT